MKKLLVVITCLTALVISCTKSNPNQVTITGKITNQMNDVVEFYSQDTTYIATVKPDGTFSLSFELDSTIHLDFAHGVESTAMYVHPGDKIHLTIDPEEFDESITYTGSPASSFLAKKYLTSEQTEFEGELYYTGSAEAYLAMIDTYTQSLLEGLKTISDSSFVSNQTTRINKSKQRYIDKQQKMVDLGQDVGAYLMEKENLYAQFDFYTSLDTLDTDGYNALLANYVSTTHDLLAQVENQDFLSTEKENINKLVDEWKGRKTLHDNVPKPGEVAAEFNYPDIHGTEVSLSSFKGKLVYVDVWATWCGPCKAEIPALQTLETEFHDKNIAFVSVSVDTDKEAWVDMVTERELGGTQLWADGWSEITKDYAIFGIPRFMLFDTEGKVISTNAVRPSSDDIRDLLNSHL